MRNQSKASEAVREAKTIIVSKRWALIGMSVQNKESSFYSKVHAHASSVRHSMIWKRWVDKKNAASHQKPATLKKNFNVAVNWTRIDGKRRFGELIRRVSTK